MSDMRFTRVGTIKPENAHKFEMFESILAVLLKNEKKEKYDDAMTVLERLMAHILFHLANRDEWHDEIEEVAAMLTNILADLVRYESGIIDEEGLKI